VAYSNEQAAIESEARIFAQHAQYRQQLTSFLEIMSTPISADEKRARFHELLGHSADFANICEQSIGDANLLGATKNEAWAKNKAETSISALDTILQTHHALVAVAAQLQAPPEAIRPSPAAFASLQRHVALFFPERVDALRTQYEEAGLPVVGFDDVAPLSPDRKELRSLLVEWRATLREVQERATTHPDQFIEADVLAGQLLKLEAEGTRLIAHHTAWLMERWVQCGLHRQPLPHARSRMLPRPVPIREIAAELRERIAILQLVEDTIAKSEAGLAATRGEFFHVLAGFEPDEPAILNDLTKESLMNSVVTPLLSRQTIRVDGHLIGIDHPRIKISRTDHSCAFYGRALELEQKRTGNVDLSINRRQLPIDRGIEVTTDFLGSLKPKKRNETSIGDPVTRTHDTIIRLVFVLGLAAIGAGVVALVFRATGSTTLNLVGVGLDTSSVAVACIAIGLLITWLTIRSVLRKMRDLAQIRPNVTGSKRHVSPAAREGGGMDGRTS
jgi:hypothetical protein